VKNTYNTIQQRFIEQRDRYNALEDRADREFVSEEAMAAAWASYMEAEAALWAWAIVLLDKHGVWGPRLAYAFRRAKENESLAERVNHLCLVLRNWPDDKHPWHGDQRQACISMQTALYLV